jgi:hypothetical protein
MLAREAFLRSTITAKSHGAGGSELIYTYIHTDRDRDRDRDRDDDHGEVGGRCSAGGSVCRWVRAPTNAPYMRASYRGAYAAACSQCGLRVARGVPEVTLTCIPAPM